MAMKREAFISAFIAAAPVGSQGWKQRAEAGAEAAWQLYLAAEREDEYAAAAAYAREKLEAERLDPAWFVHEEWGSHSFAGEMYGAQALYGGPGGSKRPQGTPLMAWEEAERQAERIRSSAACRAARAEWREFLND